MTDVDVQGTPGVVVDRETGRIVSLTYGGFEWLSEAEGFSGGADDQVLLRRWDEIMPSIAPSVSDREIHIPGHGDLVRERWREDSHGWASATLKSTPGVFSRRIIVSRTSIRILYRVETEHQESLLWAAHPLFEWSPGLRLIVGELQDGAWRREPLAGGLVAESNLVDAIRRQGASAEGKYFGRPTGKRTFAALARSDGRCVRISWCTAVVPYIGLWVDNGAWGGRPVIAIEPTTALGDSLHETSERGTVLRTTSGVPVTWELLIDFPDMETLDRAAEYE